MSPRAGEWWRLGHPSDPIPGDVDALTVDAADYASIARSISNAKLALESAFEGDALSGEAIDALRDEALQVAERIGRAWERYDGVAEALSTYLTPLRTAIDDSGDLLVRATAAGSDLDNAQQRRAYWWEEAREAGLTGDSAAFEYAQGRLDYWDGEIDAAESTLATLAGSLDTVLSTWNRHANAAADDIETVSETGELNDGFWEHVDEFFQQEWVQVALDVLAYVGAALAIVALFVPGLNLLVAAITITLLAVTALQVMSGNKSLTEGLLELALVLLPLGIGRVIGKPIMAAARTVTSKAATSVMRSAAGAGVSGVTRSQAMSKITDFAAARLPGVFKIPTGADEFRALLEMNRIVKIPMASGSPSAVLSKIDLSPEWRMFWAGLVPMEVSAAVGDVIMTAVGPEVAGPNINFQDQNW